MTKPIYAIGDIHGQTGQLERALELIAADGGPEAEIVFVGDYVDRGPDSRGVIDRLMRGQAEGRNWTCLKGNHDRMFTWFMEPFPREDPYLPVELYYLNDRIGGGATLASYGVECGPRDRKWDIHAAARAAVPPAHLDYLADLPHYHQAGDLLFVHAGIRPAVALADQEEQDLLWIRQGFLDDPRKHPWLVVHGHTAEDHPVHYGNRVDIDCGAGYGRTLVPVVFEGRESWCLTPGGRVRLEPGS
ncbi:metallophosphoesterase family protein [Tritonibacter horizontis]|uniref:Bis(5'-nucleosyl)-tetraphosphatase, symmetrical n=1 Tax=Tritonibacter horizontis TaxID=1768241 RepID=A0A132BXV2_9RHOB|nr:metallophosphoesterase family protein [Tritonibacter horizontis]KUP93223.1 Bis(5'-nucleosyl)-tetraphosphatase, symmetrical [Tritonibacter horizontis]